jgi:hypothetical protein
VECECGGLSISKKFFGGTNTTVVGLYRTNQRTNLIDAGFGFQSRGDRLEVYLRLLRTMWNKRRKNLLLKSIAKAATTTLKSVWLPALTMTKRSAASTLCSKKLGNVGKCGLQQIVPRTCDDVESTDGINHMIYVGVQLILNSLFTTISRSSL